MAHQIEQFEDGTSAFASARIAAWHQLGTITENAMTAEEALEIAQLDSEVIVSEEPVSIEINGQKLVVDDKFMTYRNHPKKGLTALGVVGSRYVPIQNQDAFGFLNNLVDESGAIFETAGAIKEGRRVFMSIRMPETMSLASGADSAKMYIMATNSHDGSSSFTVAVTPVRVVCTNTVNMALKSAHSKINLRHTNSAQGKIAQAKQVLGLVHNYEIEFAAEVQKLTDQVFNDRQFEKLVEDLFPISDDSTLALTTKRTNQRETLLDLWTAPTQQIVAGTKWAAYNAVVEYADWFSPVRGKNPAENRAKRILTGELDGLKNKALTLLNA